MTAKSHMTFATMLTHVTCFTSAVRNYFQFLRFKFIRLFTSRTIAECGMCVMTFRR